MIAATIPCLADQDEEGSRGTIVYENGKIRYDSGMSEYSDDTLAPPGGIVVYGDSRTDNITHEQIADAIIKIRPRVVFHTGDIVDSRQGISGWDTPMEIISKLRKRFEFFPAKGNTGDESPEFEKNFNLPNSGHWYSLDRQGIHFVVLDTNLPMDSASGQYKWLENDLKEARGKSNYIVAIFHHPVFNTGYHSEDVKGLKYTILPLFEKYGVNICFSGHDHHYERSKYHNIFYIVTGGGGAPLYGRRSKSHYSQFFIKEYHFCYINLDQGELVVTVYDINLNILDKFSVIKS
jgi:predicted phosphodiesterase